jgi:hypothetical protein
MTQNEALALLNVTDGQDPEEQFELVFFEYKQKIYRQLDQVLLYPKWINALENLSKAAETLLIPTENQEFTIPEAPIFSPDTTLVDLYNQQQQIKVQVAHLLYNCVAPKNALKVLEAYQKIMRTSFDFWAQAGHSNTEVKLSQQFDPIAILETLKDLAQKGISHINELDGQNTPQSLKVWIAWNKALQAKISKI